MNFIYNFSRVSLEFLCNCLNTLWTGGIGGGFVTETFINHLAISDHLELGGDVGGYGDVVLVVSQGRDIVTSSPHRLVHHPLPRQSNIDRATTCRLPEVVSQYFLIFQEIIQLYYLFQ